MADKTTTRTATPSHSLPPADASVQSCVHCGRSPRPRAAALAPDALCQQEVLGHERDAPRVPCARVRILDDLHHVSLRGLLQKDEALLREAEIRTHLLRDLAHEAYKRRPWQYRLGGGLVLANFPERSCPGTVARCGLNSTEGRRLRLANKLGPKDATAAGPVQSHAVFLQIFLGGLKQFLETSVPGSDLIVSLTAR